MSAGTTCDRSEAYTKIPHEGCGRQTTVASVVDEGCGHKGRTADLTKVRKHRQVTSQPGDRSCGNVPELA